MASPEEVAWVAGLFEGEGCFAVHYQGSRAYLQVVLGSTDLDVLERLRSITGYGAIRSIKARPDRKPFWRWAVSRRDDVDHFVAMIRPWLCSRRLERLDEILAIRAERERGTAEVCIRGHERAVLPCGRAQCRPCRAEAARRFKAKKAAS